MTDILIELREQFPDLKPLHLAMARIAAATGYPETHFGGVGWVRKGGYRPPKYQEEAHLSLPGGGMVAVASECRGNITLSIESFGAVSRAEVTVRPCYPEGATRTEQLGLAVRTTIVEGVSPRARDMARARMWARIAEGVPSHQAAQAEGLGANLGHAHAGSPPLEGEETAVETAIRLLKIPGEMAHRVKDPDRIFAYLGRKALYGE